jgi:hypothetical protein
MCRCAVCRQAHREKSQEEKQRRLGEAVPDRVHGTLNGYNYYACRCTACCLAHQDYCRWYYQYQQWKKQQEQDLRLQPGPQKDDIDDIWC